jgi:Fic family protein
MSTLSLKLIEQLFINPYITITETTHRLKTTYPTAKSMIDKFVKAGIVVEITSKRRDKVYCAKELLSLLGKE